MAFGSPSKMQHRGTEEWLFAKLQLVRFLFARWKAF